MREPSEAATPASSADPATAAELLLLLRIALADARADERTLAALRRVALRDLGIAEEGIDEVVAEIEHLVDAAGCEGLAAALRAFSAARRSELAGLAVQVTARDWELAPLRRRLEARLAVLLGGQVLPDARTPSS